MGEGGAHDGDGAEEVDGDDPLPGVARDVGQRAAGVRAGRRDNAVDATPPLRDAPDHLLDGGAVGEVDGLAVDSRARLLDVERHGRLAQPAHHRRAQAGRPPGHDHRAHRVPSFAFARWISPVVERPSSVGRITVWPFHRRMAAVSGSSSAE